MSKRDDSRTATSDAKIALALTSAQIREVVRGARQGEGGLSLVLDGSEIAEDGVLELEAWERRYSKELSTGSASSSLLRGLLVLACFPRDGTMRTVHWVAERTGMEVSTTHRYIRTLLMLGFLEQDQKTRAYGRAQA